MNLNTDKLIAALTGAIDARKAAIPNPSAENDERYKACRDEVEHELQVFIAGIAPPHK